MWSWKLIKDLADSSLFSALERQVVTFGLNTWVFPDWASLPSVLCHQKRALFTPPRCSCTPLVKILVFPWLYHRWDDTSFYLDTSFYSLKFGRPLPQQDELICTVYLSYNSNPFLWALKAQTEMICPLFPWVIFFNRLRKKLISIL